MVTIIEKELKQADLRVKSLMSELDMDTVSKNSLEIEQAKMERKVLHKLLNEQKVQRRKTLFAVENGLLLFAIAMFGLLAAFVTYLVGGYNVSSPTWEQLGSDMTVMILLVTMTTLSGVLYIQHYRHKINGN